MTRKEKQGELLLLINTGYQEAMACIAEGKRPKFESFERAKQLAEEAEETSEYTQCINCNLVLEIGVDSYSRFFLSGWLKCDKARESSETPMVLQAKKRELVLCHACATPITTFLSKEG